MKLNKNQNDAPDQEERVRILNELDRSLLVEAAAGTGKTTMMVERMIALIEKGKTKIQNIAAITFTRKAAAEIRSRFRAKLEEAVSKVATPERELLAEALSDLDKCFIGTIHSFCARLLRERPVEAGVDIAFREIDEEEDSLIRRKAWEQYTDRLCATNDPILKELDLYGLELKDIWHAFRLYATFPDVDEWPVDDSEPLDLTQARKLLDEIAGEEQRLKPFFGGIYSRQDDLMKRYSRMWRMIREADFEHPAETMRIVRELRRKDPDLEVDKWPQGETQAKKERARWNEYAERARIRHKELSRICHPSLMKAIEPARHAYDRLREDLGVLNFQDLLLKSAVFCGRIPMFATTSRNDSLIYSWMSSRIQILSKLRS